MHVRGFGAWGKMVSGMQVDAASSQWELRLLHAQLLALGLAGWRASIAPKDDPMPRSSLRYELGPCSVAGTVG